MERYKCCTERNNLFLSYLLTYIGSVTSTIIIVKFIHHRFIKFITNCKYYTPWQTSYLLHHLEITISDESHEAMKNEIHYNKDRISIKNECREPRMAMEEWQMY